jgi:KUP system potassium uptake protein
LNLFPKVTVNYPSESKGQLYIPMVNWILCFGCIGIVLIFQSSTAMEAAYGLAITVTMLMTTVLLIYYLLLKHVATGWRILLLAVYLPIEGAFLVANLEKFPHGGYVTLIVASFIIAVMFVFKLAHEIKARLSTTVKLSDYLPLLKKLSLDTNEVKYATHLVYLTSARSDNEVERNVLLSILQNQPKRADYYWFVHVEVDDEPYTMSCKVKKMEADDVIRVKFKLGFRVQQKIGMFMRIITEKMLLTGDIRGINHEYHLIEHDHAGDFRFVIVEEVVSYNNPLSFFEKNIMQAYTTIKSWTGNPKKWFGLDHSLVDVEKIPVVFAATDLKMPLEIKVCSISPEEGEKTI